MSKSMWVIVPAAGVGRRMAEAIPKQYLPLLDRAVVEWSIAPFLANESVAGVVVVLATDDHRFATLPVAKNPRVQTAIGGRERADSVLRGLLALQAPDSDWVLVHDAARPCLQVADLDLLIDELKNDAVGGLLAVPVADTLKSSDAAKRVSTTVSRDGLWRALTPQMFRYGLLKKALLAAADSGAAVTDEASAVERLGLQPKLIEGRTDNIKITVPEDLAYAEYLLRTRKADG